MNSRIYINDHFTVFNILVTSLSKQLSLVQKTRLKKLYSKMLDLTPILTDGLKIFNFNSNFIYSFIYFVYSFLSVLPLAKIIFTVQSTLNLLNIHNLANFMRISLKKFCLYYQASFQTSKKLALIL